MDIQRDTQVIDAAGRPLGRLASEIAQILSGKNKPSYQPHLDTGDMVVVKNAGQVVLTGKKTDQKLYHRSTRYPGGIRTEAAKDLIVENPEKMIRNAVEHMIDDNKLRRGMMKRLRFEKN